MMSLRLSSPVTDVPRIGPAKAKTLEKLNIQHVRDFLYTIPRKYEDFSTITPIAKLEVGKQCTVLGKVKKVKSHWGFQGRRRLLRIYVDIADESGTLNVTWYNLRFLAKQLVVGREVYIAGTVEPSKTKYAQFTMRSPALEFADGSGERAHTGRIIPIYPETAGVTSRFIRYQVQHLLPLIEALPEYLPAAIRKRQKLRGIHQAFKAIHFPQNQAELAEAQRRLRFDELFFLQLAALVRRNQLTHLPAQTIRVPKRRISALAAGLPFPLTGAQQRVLEEVRKDLAESRPMNRLLQGDVGSGKSAVALIALQAVLETKCQAVYLAPTEILARQQAEHFKSHLGPAKVALLVGALRSADKKAVKQQLASDESLLVIGTHALLQEDVQATNVALAVIDEQHRFGVAQRRALQRINENNVMPHLLSMTATPIPRTLSLTVYGDLDVSVLDEMPPGRKLIETHIVAPAGRDEVILKVLTELHRGRQAYVIAPLVEDSPRLEVKSATQTAAEMKELFPDIAVGLLHGQMTAEEKDAVMRSFADGTTQLLVATVVVEVGINVPNATIMMIEGAERFGLAQLHQLRGRVGRGEHQSYCYAFPSNDQSSATARLEVFAHTNDGFVIAERDLELRGPGEVYGITQSGFGDLKVASLLDYPTISSAREEAKRLLAKDPALAQYPILRKKVERKNLQTHFE